MYALQARAQTYAGADPYEVASEMLKACWCTSMCIQITRVLELAPTEILEDRIISTLRDTGGLLSQ